MRGRKTFTRWRKSGLARNLQSDGRWQMAQPIRRNAQRSHCRDSPPDTTIPRLTRRVNRTIRAKTMPEPLRKAFYSTVARFASVELPWRQGCDRLAGPGGTVEELRELVSEQPALTAAALATWRVLQWQSHTDAVAPTGRIQRQSRVSCRRFSALMRISSPLLSVPSFAMSLSGCRFHSITRASLRSLRSLVR